MMAPQAPGAQSAARADRCDRSTKGDHSQIDDARQVDRCARPRSGTTLWRQHAGDRARPPVDFAQGDGRRRVPRQPADRRLYDRDRWHARGWAALIVQYRETRPAAGGITAQVLTSPYHLVAMPKPARRSDRRQKFEKVTRSGCGRRAGATSSWRPPSRPRSSSDFTCFGLTVPLAWVKFQLLEFILALYGVSIVIVWTSPG